MTGSILMSLGFSPLAAAGLALIANTAPVAFGALGAPITGLQQATQLDYNMLGAMVGRQLPLFSVIGPFGLIWAFAGFRAAKEIWPAALICGVTFGVSQFAISNYISPSLAFFFQAEDGIRYLCVTGVQTCALPICARRDETLARCRAFVASDPVKIRIDRWPFRVLAGNWVLESAERQATGLWGARADRGGESRSEERRVGKECRSRWSPYH